jgi:hydrophobic/amphiphilic exporter-1 (mainly G- bacteria), HAE1 family
MWISDTSIRRPVLATMAILSFVVLGIVSMSRLGIDLFPDVSIPYVVVNTVYPGASPEEVETLVSRPVEDAVSAINGIKRVESRSTESFSSVVIEFRIEVDPQVAAADVREKVTAIRARLPEEAEDPTIARFDVSALPIMTFAVSSALPPDVTRRSVEDDLKPLLEQIDGVAAVDVNGGEVREIQVDLDPRRLEALGLPVSAVAGALEAENLDVPAGTITTAGRDVALRTKGEFTSLDEIRDVILRSSSGSTVRLSDVATVRDLFEERKTTTRLNGVDAVSFSIRKQSKVNTVEVARRVHSALERARPGFPALTITPVHDDSEYIRANVRDVRFNIIFGGVMAVLIIFVFMRDWRSTVISALALPTSVISTFFFMWLVGFTINMMTLMALSLVIGILIDDAVVVRENIYRHMEHGEDAVAAAHRGTSEIGLAVMATTFTILAVFLPVGFMTGIVGQFFKSFALTVAFAVAMSLLVAFTLDPMLSSRFVRYIPPEERRRTRFGRVLEHWGDLYEQIDRAYHALLGIAIRHPLRTVALATVVFLGSLSSLALVATEFMPSEDRSQFDVLVDLPPGTSFAESERAVGDFERLLFQAPEVRQVFSTVGYQGEIRKSVLRVRTTPKNLRTRGLEQIKTDLRQRFATVPFAEVRVMNPPFIQGAPNEAPIQIYVRGDNLEDLQRISDEIVRKARAIRGAVDVNSTLVGGQPEMVARIDRARAADMGFSVGAVAVQLRGMVEGIVASQYRDGGKQYDIRVRLAPEFRNDVAAIARAPIYSPRGSGIRVSDIVRMESGVGPARIQREQRRRQARIDVGLQDRALGDATGEVNAMLAGLTLPQTFEVGLQGDVELMQETTRGIILALALAVAFIYIVLASQFESFVEPLIIMLSLPLAIVGALLMLLLTRHLLGISAMIGMVMLMGLVTKNAILLVDYTNQIHRQGTPVEQAILKAGPTRLRPILMTTMAMILGMMPSALGTGEGGEFRAPMALAVIGGLITSTLLTLVLVPVVYLLVSRLSVRVRTWRRHLSPAVTAAVRITSIIIALVLISAIVAVARAFAETPATPRVAAPLAAPRPVSPSPSGPATSCLSVDAIGKIVSEVAPQDAGPGAAAGPRPAPLVLTIDSALRIAADQNESLKVDRERVSEMRSRVSEASAAFLPSLNLNFLYTPAQRFPMIRIPAGIFGPNEMTFSAAFTRQNIMRLDLVQPIYAGGRLRTNQRIATDQLRETELELERARQALRLEVVQTFYAALMSEQGVKVANEGVRLAENHLALAKIRFDAGTAAKLDVLRGEVELARARATQIQARTAQDTASKTLRTVLSLPVGAAVRVDGTLDQAPDIPDRAELLGALPSRPDIAAVHAQRRMAEGAVTMANGEMKPTLAFSANLQYQEDGFSSLWNGQSQSYQLGVALQVPLFSAPAALARRGAATAQARQAEHGAKALLEAAVLEFDTAWAELEAARELVDTAQKAVEFAREGLSIAEVSYENGVITSVELSDARQSLLESEWGLTKARFAQIVAAEKVRFAAGQV